jgi:small subunit ribosomal protein S11
MGKRKIQTKDGMEETKKAEAKVEKKKSIGRTKKRKKKKIPKAKVFIRCSYNNTVISFTDYSGNVFAWSSTGCAGFRGSKKGTAFAATRAAYDAFDKARRFGVSEASVIVKGVGMGRKAAVKGLRTAGLVITSLSDHTPVPHNGCRPRKRPRGS